MTTVATLCRTILLLLVIGVILTLSGSSYHSLFQQRLEQDQLRVVTTNGAHSYYQTRSGMTGFEYELALAFSEYYGLQLEVIEVDNLAQGQALVTNGAADFMAASVLANPLLYPDLEFAQPYDRVSHRLVSRLKSDIPDSLVDAANGSLMVAKGSNEAAQLRLWQQQQSQLSWREADNVATYDLLKMIADDALGQTLINNRELALVRDFFPQLKMSQQLDQATPVAWAFKRQADRSLLQAANQFLSEPATAILLSDLDERFFGHLQQVDFVENRNFRRQLKRTLPKYQPLFKKYAEQTGIDWRLLAATSYQESKWNARARSYTGVRGLMMLTRTTAAELGISDRINPENSIRGGAQYLKKLRQRLPKEIEEPDRTWFALAAYNVGYGHLTDARKLTEDLGGDGGRWLDVKEVLPLLRQKRFYRRTRYGFARGEEPVRYVQNIRRYYDLLVHQDNGSQLSINDSGLDDLPITLIPPKNESSN